MTHPPQLLTLFGRKLLKAVLDETIDLLSRLLIDSITNLKAEPINWVIKSVFFFFRKLKKCCICKTLKMLFQFFSSGIKISELLGNWTRDNLKFWYIFFSNSSCAIFKGQKDVDKWVYRIEQWYVIGLIRVGRDQSVCVRYCFIS